MEKANDTVGNLCKMGIFLCILFIIIPPLFRLIYSDNTKTEVQTESTTKTLSCFRTESNTDGTTAKEVITNTYLENTLYTIKFIFTDAKEENAESLITKDLKTITDAGIEKTDSYYYIRKDDFTKYSFLENFTGTIDNQKTINTNNGFTCNIE